MSVTDVMDVLESTKLMLQKTQNLNEAQVSAKKTI